MRDFSTDIASGGRAPAESAQIASKLLERLDIAGQELLGVGYSGFVFGARRHDRVLKVGFNGGDPWPEWAAWCRSNPGPHRPVVHDLVAIAVEGRRELFAASIERLDPAPAMRRYLKTRLGIARRLKARPTLLAEAVEAEWPSVASAIREAYARFPSARWDMAASNWMQRADGTLVMTDPISGL